MAYTSRKPPPAEIWGDEKLMALFHWMEGELDAIAQDSQETIALELRETQQIPKKPREGMIVRADGTGWNPGSGKGLYTYKSGAWVKVNEGTVDKYSSITDGTTTAAASGADTIKFRANSGLTVAVGSNDATHGDNVLYSVDLSGFTAETAIATGDYIVIRDVSAGADRKMLVSDFLKIINALTEDTSPDTAADYVMTWDNSASAVKKALLSNIAPPPLTLISSGSVGTGTTLTVALGATYKMLFLAWHGVSHDNGTSRALQLAVSDDGTNFDATGDLTSAGNSAQNFFGEGVFYNAGVASTNKMVHARAGLAPGTMTVTGHLLTTETGITTHIRMLWNGAGNFDGGTYYLWGLK